LAQVIAPNSVTTTLKNGKNIRIVSFAKTF